MGMLGVSFLMLMILLVGLIAVALIRKPRRVTSVVLVVLDTARLDHLTPYGYTRETTPRLMQLAQEGLLFERARSAAPWTLPSHASIFTGKLPSQHGCHWEHRWLADSQETIAEVMAKSGFETIGVTTNVNASSLYHLEQGFDRFFETWRLRDSHRGLDDSAIANALIRDFLDLRQPERPFFLFVNYADAHLPYTPPPPYDSMFGAASPRARALAARPDLLHAVLSGEVKLTADDLSGLAALYDGELRKVDGFLGELLDELDRRGLADDTVVIVTSDHGELLGEDGLVDHQLSLREELLHVPLLVRWPRLIHAARVPEPVSLTAIKPWLDEIAVGRVPAWSPSPERLPDVIDSEYFRPVDVVEFVRSHGGNADAIDVRQAAAWRRDGTGALKLIVRDDGDVRLLRIRPNTPEEPWADPPKELVSSLRESLEAVRALDRFHELAEDLRAEVAPEARALDDLRRLGYVGASAHADLSVHANEHWAAGERAQARGDAVTALIELKRAAQIAPGQPDLLLALARVADGIASPETAEILERYLRAVGRSPSAGGDAATWARARLEALRPGAPH
jgi:arylsulfatase A-like enzyme